VGVADPIAELGPAPANFTHLCHEEILPCGYYFPSTENASNTLPGIPPNWL
jgi:hypothetical protein